MENLVTPFRSSYQNSRVLVTGHTGFKGSWLSPWLRMMDAEVYRYSLDPPTTPHLYRLLSAQIFADEKIDDIRNVPTLTEKFTHWPCAFLRRLTAPVE